MNRFFACAQDRVSCETHTIGAAAALAGALLYLIRAVKVEAPMIALAAALCFCFSMVALYSASAIYHFYPGTASSGGIKRRLRKMDHSMIYVLIAGSYTPFAVVLLPQPKGTRFCLAMWGVALPRTAPAEQVLAFQQAWQDAVDSEEFKAYCEEIGIKPAAITGDEADKLLSEGEAVYVELLESLDMTTVSAADLGIASSAEYSWDNVDTSDLIPWPAA